MPLAGASGRRDRDHDGLSNRYEVRRSHTNPRRRDTDRDRLNDGYEVRRSHTNPRRRDTDRDRLSDRYELRVSHTKPRRRDTDRDRLNDGYEVRRSHTNPRRWDTDGDGLGDGLETQLGFDPRDPGSPGPRAQGSGPIYPHLPAIPVPPPVGDQRPPDTTISSGPAGTTNSTSASFSFSSSESDSTFQCRLDGGAWSGCSSPRSYSGLANGSHAFEVRATDGAGNTDASPASRTWTVSVTAPPPPSGANVFLSPGGSDSAACSQAAPCRSMNRGYQVAQPGQTVELAGGSYGDQSINRDTAKTSANDVVFQPATGANVTVGSVTSYASHLTVKDMKATDLVARVNDPPQGTVSDITFQNMDARNFMVYSATDVTVRGGDYGPASDCGGPYGGSNNSIRRYPGAANPNNILIDGAKIHDITSYDLNACHMEGLAVFAGTNVRVRDSKFFGNSVYDMFLQGNSGPVSDLTVENNWFAAPVGQGGSGSGSSTLAFSGGSGDFANTLIRHNSFNGIISPDDNGANPSYSNFRMVGNVGQLPWNGCSLHVTYSYNVWKSSACGTGDLNLGGGAYPYVSAANSSALDYHLTGGSAIDRVPTSMSGPLDDIDGDTRPMGAGRDAGADEDH